MKAAKPWATPLRGLFICISVCAVLFGPSIAMADGSGRSSSRQPASTVDSLKRQPVRDGLFIGWCGSAGSFITQQNRARFVHTPALSEPIALPSGYIMGCDASAEHVVFSNLSVHAATKIRIKDQTTTLFARFRDADRANLLISPSPDLARIAFDPGGAELDQDGNPGNVTLVPVERSATSWKSHTIAWKSDLSILFHIVERSAGEGSKQSPSQEIEVIDVRSGSRRRVGCRPVSGISPRFVPTESFSPTAPSSCCFSGRLALQVSRKTRLIAGLSPANGADRGPCSVASWRQRYHASPSCRT